MRTFAYWLSFALCAAHLGGAERPTDNRHVVLVVGVPGEAQYASNHLGQVEVWQTTAQSVDLPVTVIGPGQEGMETDREQLRHLLSREPAEAIGPLWLILIGHGTFDGEEARFSLRGPDLTATELSEWLKPFRRPMVIVNTSSSSGPFLAKLSGTNRVVITATRSGHEQYYTRFGTYFARAMGLKEADLDKDEQVSVLEGFLVAAGQTAEFYKAEGRISTEHALLDDNGDGLGTSADWFVGLRAAKKPKPETPIDGLLARQICVVPSAAEHALAPEWRGKRDALERAVYALRERKAEMPAEEYFRQLDALLIELARLYEGW